MEYFKHTPTCQVHDLHYVYDLAFGSQVDGFFVDVGAFDGVQWSNTRALSQAGWRGLYVEPHPDHFAMLQDNVESRHILEQVAISDVKSSTRLYLGGSLTTIVPKTIDYYLATDWGKFTGLNEDNYITVRTTTLDALLQEHKIESFDVLSLDIEGAEIKALKGFTVEQYRPKVIIVETHALNDSRDLRRKSRWVDAYMRKHSYYKVIEDTINTVYTSSELVRDAFPLILRDGD